MSSENLDIRISGAVLDQKIGAQIKSQLKNITDLSIHVDHVDLGNSAISDIKKTLAKNQIALKVDLESPNIKQQAQAMGLNVGGIISTSAQKAISSVSSDALGSYFKISPATSNQFKAEMEKLVSQWTDTRGKLSDIKIDTKSFY